MFTRDGRGWGALLISAVDCAAFLARNAVLQTRPGYAIPSSGRMSAAAHYHRLRAEPDNPVTSSIEALRAHGRPLTRRTGTMDQQPFIFRRGPYEIFILLLTVIALVNGAVLFFWPNEIWSSVLRYMDWAISVIFFADFFWMLHQAKNKRAYVFRGWGWADFLGSFPIPGFRLFRLIRGYVVSRRLRAEGMVGLRRGFRGKLSESTLLFVTLGLIVLIEIGCVLVLSAEDNSPNANIRTGGEAIWWAVVTVATVGYGDYYPVTPYGRIIGALMMAGSVALVAVFTAYIANSFFNRQAREEGHADPTLALLRADIEALHQTVRELQATIDRTTGTSSPPK
jgi:voltage-gated potassium channel